MKPSNPIPIKPTALILITLLGAVSCSEKQESTDSSSESIDKTANQTPPRPRSETVSTIPSRQPVPNKPSKSAPKPGFKELANKIESGSASDEEQIAFWESVKSSPEFDAMVDDLESLVSSDQATVENRLELADLYVLKIVTASSDPIRGVWGNKATQTWNEVLVEDPTNWKAQHSIAYSLSQYPDFLNKSDESIAAYEKLIAFPAAANPEPKQAKAFDELSQLYLKRGRPVDARGSLERGLERYPDHQSLQQSLTTLETQFAFEE